MIIVMLPGLDGTGELFNPLLEVLPNDINVQIVRYPKNTKNGYDELVEYVMKQLPKEDFILVGESFSGPIAYQIARINPINLYSVIFVATFLESPSRVLLKLSELFPRKHILATTLPKAICKIFMLGRDAGAEIIVKFQQIMKLVRPEVLDYRLNLISKLHVDIEPINVKATYIMASDDKLVPERCVNKFMQAFNELQIVNVVGPHFILQASPAECAKVIVNEVNL